jgi:hypothetical protein
MRHDDLTARTAAPPASRPFEGSVTAERATIRPAPGANADTAPAPDARARHTVAPHQRNEPQTSGASPLPVTVAPPAAPTATAPSRPPVVELPQARSERAAVPTPTAPAASAAEPPRIHVRIGKVEVRASAPVAAPARVVRSDASRGFSDLRLARAHLDRNHR